MVTKITSEYFGTTSDGRKVTKFTLTNSGGLSASVLDYGGIITELMVPDKGGNMADVLLGFDNMADWEKNPPFFGTLVGRVANRIDGAEFSLDGQTYKLHKNWGPTSIHGGKVGFDKKVWKTSVTEDKLTLTYISEDGEEGYPGTLATHVTYCLDDQNCLTLDYTATTTQATPINLTNHAYFNLGGHTCGHINDHVVTIHADSYLPLNENCIPTGEIRPVRGTPYDLRTPHRLGDVLTSVPGGKGFDNNFCLDNNGNRKLACQVDHPPSGRRLVCHTTSPGLQLYTAYYLDNMAGKQGHTYGQYGGFCLEAQHYPDSVHQPKFPSSILRPGETYRQTTSYTFGLL